MQTLWPSGVKFVGLVTDAALYMKKTAEGLLVSYPRLIRVTFVAHALHRVCETIRMLYPNLDKLVGRGKEFLKTAPNTPFAPIPIIVH
jgi:hypothetical protein